MIDIILVFCYVFCFSLRGGSGIDSSMVVASYLIIYSVFHTNYVNKVFDFFKSSYFHNICILYVIINLWCLIVVTVNLTFDISYLLSFLHSFLLIGVGILLYQYIDYHHRSDKIVSYLVIVFLLQTIIEWTAFLSPDFKDIINYTKSQTAIEGGEKYTGVRANGLSGSDFFGLSAAFACIYVIFLSERNTLLNKNRVLKSILYIFLLSGTFFAGRTGYVGFVIALFLLLFRKRKRSVFSVGEKVALFFTIPSVISFFSYIIYLYNTNSDIYNVFNYTFEALFNLADNGHLTTTSTEKLEDHYFTIGPVTFLLGDGKYSMDDGSYYGNTDVGYMRVILYMGIIGHILLFIMQQKIVNVGKSIEPLLAKSILFLLLILHAKGEVFVWNQVVVGTLTLFCVQNIFCRRLEPTNAR